MGRSPTRRRRKPRRSDPWNKLAILFLAAVAVAAFVYFNRSPGAVAELIEEILSAAETPAPQRPTGRPPVTATAPEAQGNGRDDLGGDYPERPAGLQRATVVGVVDGDTVDIRYGNNRTERLRLIGLDTPESVDRRRPVECYGLEASNRAKELLGGQVVYLEGDPSQDTRDRFGRLLRFVWLEDGRLYNLEMIAQGYAFEYTYDKAYKYQAAFRGAEEAAREAQRGLWAETTCAGERRPAE
jgi:micrococcal nuclease